MLGFRNAAPALILLLIGLIGAPRGFAAPATQPLLFQVVDDATSMPLEAAQLKITINGKETTSATDAHGVAPIELAETVDSLTVRAAAENHVPMYVAWTMKQDNPVPPPRDRFTLRMPHGVVVGGVVQDEQGNPIAGAKVAFSSQAQFNSSTMRRGIPFPSGAEITATTDAAGKWSCDQAMAKWETAYLKISHPEFVSDPGAFIEKDNAKLREGTLVSVMKKGVALGGFVRDSDGKPIAGASVGYDMDHSSQYSKTKTDENGAYRFGHILAERKLVMVRAAGFAPQLREVALDDKTAAVDFQLKPATIYRGRVVDPSGAPLAGTRIALDTIDGRNLLTSSGGATTDEQGRFKIEGGEAAQLVTALARDFNAARAVTLNSEQETTIRLRKPFKASGAITDAQTGEPIAAGKITISHSEAARPIWQTQDPHPFENGRYQVSISETGPSYLLLFEAQGYTPLISRVFKPDEAEAQYDVKLNRGAGTPGTVQDSNGKPVAGAALYVVTSARSLQVNNDRVSPHQGGESVVRAGDDGHFTIPPQRERFALLVTADAGYARVDGAALSNSGTVTLTAWASLDGVVKIGSKAAAKAHITGGFADRFDQDNPLIYFSINAEADAAGRFHIDRIAALPASVGRMVETSDRLFTEASSVRIDPKPGEHVSIQIGGAGRPVVGRVILPTSVIKTARWVAPMAWIRTKMPEPPPITYPENWKEMPQDEKRRWLDKLNETEPMKAFEAAQKEVSKRSRHYSLFLERDGTFRVEDVEPDEYELSIEITSPPTRYAHGPGEDKLARVETTITMPPVAGGQSDEPLELPPMLAGEIKEVKIGETAPAFTVPTADGKTISLADYRGKYVLLDFWATWCGPCVKAIPEMKATYEAYGKRENFVMISLSLDEKIDDVQRVVASEQLTWPQGIIGEWGKSSVAADYGIHGIPSVWLIDPNGKVIAKHLASNLHDLAGLMQGR